MPDSWTGELLGKMHNAGVTQRDIADRLGFSRAYISMIFNSRRGKRKREEMERVVDEIVAERHDG